MNITAFKAKVTEMGNLNEERAREEAVIDAHTVIEMIDQLSWKNLIPMPHISTGPTGNLLFQWDGTDTGPRELYISFKENEIHALIADDVKVIEIDNYLKEDENSVSPKIHIFDKIIACLNWLVNSGELKPQVEEEK